MPRPLFNRADRFRPFKSGSNAIPLKIIAAGEAQMSRFHGCESLHQIHTITIGRFLYVGLNRDAWVIQNVPLPYQPQRHRLIKSSNLGLLRDAAFRIRVAAPIEDSSV